MKPMISPLSGASARPPEAELPATTFLVAANLTTIPAIRLITPIQKTTGLYAGLSSSMPAPWQMGEDAYRQDLILATYSSPVKSLALSIPSASAAMNQARARKLAQEPLRSRVSLRLRASIASLLIGLFGTQTTPIRTSMPDPGHH